MARWRRTGIRYRRTGGLIVAASLMAAGCTDPAERSASPTMPGRAVTLKYGSGDSPEPFGVAVPVPSTQSPVTVGNLPLCSSDPSPATVTQVRFSSSTGVKVTSYSVRPINPATGTMFGADTVTLRQAGFPARPEPVTARCGRQDELSELALQLQATQPTKVTASDVQVIYTSAGRQGTLDVPFTVVLCVGGQATQCSAD